MYSIGEIIATYRKKKGLLQQDLADELEKEGFNKILILLNFLNYTDTDTHVKWAL